MQSNADVGFLEVNLFFGKIRNIMLLFLQYLAIAFTIFILPCSAGAQTSRFSAAFTAEARSDLVNLTLRHGWSERQISFALDTLATALEVRGNRRGSLPPVSNDIGALRDSIQVVVNVSPERERDPNCAVASVALENTLRPVRSAISGLFCSRSSTTWTFSDRFLEVTDADQAGRVIRTTDVTALGRRRPQ